MEKSSSSGNVFLSRSRRSSGDPEVASSSSSDLLGTTFSELEQLFPAPDDRDVDEHTGKVSSTRRQILFGVDLSAFPVHLQFAIPCVGLFSSMLLYGYLQELVVYGLFERKWSNLQTFLHFAGCIIAAEAQSFLTATRHHSKHWHKSMSFVSMGTASQREALTYYLLLTCLKTATMTLTNLSMTRINYPAKTMCKSALPIVTMAIGLGWFRRTYPVRDYIVSVLLVLGLYLFVAVDASASPQGTSIGLVFVTLSLLCSALVPMVQEHVLEAYDATTEEVLYFSFLGSAAMSLALTFVAGEAFDGLAFLLTKGSLFMWVCFTAFNTCSFFGAACSIAITARFGSVVNALTNTSRKALSIALSFVMFPERNALTLQHVLGALVFFSGIVYRGLSKGGDHHNNINSESRKRRHSANSQIILTSDSNVDFDELGGGNNINNNNNSSLKSRRISSQSPPKSSYVHNRTSGMGLGSMAARLFGIRDVTQFPSIKV